MGSSSKQSQRCSIPNAIVSCLNLLLFILASASIAPIILVRTPPTSSGWALLISSFISLASSLLGLFSRLTKSTQGCFLSEVSFQMASIASQGLSFFALFVREKQSLSMLDSHRGIREAVFLTRLDCLILVAQLVTQLTVLLLTCALHCCSLREYHAFQADRHAMEMKRSMKINPIYQQSISNVNSSFEGKSVEMDDKTNNKPA